MLQDNQFSLMKEHFPSSTQLSLLKRKGVYPYNYLTSFEKFDETRLPSPETFFSSLTEEDVSDEDYINTR